MQQRMLDIGHKLAQRLQRETAQMHTGMGYLQGGDLYNIIVEQHDVDVDGTRGVDTLLWRPTSRQRPLPSQLPLYLLQAKA